MLTLYHNDMSVCSQKVRLCLAEKALAHEARHLNLRAGDQQKPEYLKLNPKGVVPTLVDDGVYMMDNNFTYSKLLLQYAIQESAPLVYASTAAVYGLSGPGHFTPTLENEKPCSAAISLDPVAHCPARTGSRNP